VRSRCYLCVCVYPAIVAGQRLGKNPLIVARQRLGRNPPIVARQRLGKNPPIVARQRLDNEYTRSKRRIVGRVVFSVARVVSRKVGD
jgi:hypothetical protein